MLGVCQGVFFAMWLGTFLLSQMNGVELARTSSWRENALFEERKRTFMRPGERIWRCGRLHVRFAPHWCSMAKVQQNWQNNETFRGLFCAQPLRFNILLVFIQLVGAGSHDALLLLVDTLFPPLLTTCYLASWVTRLNVVVLWKR